MISRQVEAVVLRTWPIHEADQIVSLFTRDCGKIKGVAKSAARSRRRFGGALEPMTYVRAHYVEKPSQELVRLDSFEILRSPLAQPVDYGRATALAFFAEVLEQILPDHDPHDLVFRLLLSVLEHTQVGTIWMPVTYFALWITRLMGWLPDMNRCQSCSVSLAGQPAWFHSFVDGMFCGQHSQDYASALSPEEQQLAVHMLRAPAAAFAQNPWHRSHGAALRRYTVQILERHLERKLRTAVVLAQLPAG